MLTTAAAADPDGERRDGAGLALLMRGLDGRGWRLERPRSERCRESFADAPPESWGRPIGAIKARLLAGD